MKKKQRNIIIGIVLILIIGIIISQGFGEKTLVLPSIPSGCKFSILSIDSVSLSNNPSDLGEQIFQITLSGNEGGQCVYGYLDVNDLEQEIGSALGKKVETKYATPFLISLNRTETSAYYYQYPNYDKEVEKYKYTPKGSPKTTFLSMATCLAGSFSQSSCSNQCSGASYDFKNCEQESITKVLCYCGGFSSFGYLYGFNKDRLFEKLDVVVTTGDGITKQFTLNTDSNRDYFTQEGFRDGLSARFEGFLQGVDLIPDSTGKVYDYSGIKKIVNGAIGVQNPFCENKMNWETVESCMLIYNNEVNDGLGQEYSFRNAVISGSSIKLPISSDTFYPVIKIQLKAKWLGIYEPVAEPDLFDCQGTELNYRINKEGYLNYKLQIKPNTGSEGTFQIYSSCSNSDFLVNPTENSKTVVGAQIVSGQIKINQQNNKDSSFSCTIKASIQRLGFQAEDTCSVNVIGKSSCSLETEVCGSGCCDGLRCTNNICEKIPGVEICYNQEDDDGDGLVDCLDSDCDDYSACGGGGNQSCILKTCGDCGTGLFNLCDRAECELCSNSLNCAYTPQFIGGTCVDKNAPGECADCDAFANSRLFSYLKNTGIPQLDKYTEEKQCEPKKPSIIPPNLGQNDNTCIFSWFKILLIPIVFIFTFLFGKNFFERDKIFKIKNKYTKIIISLLIAGVLSFLVYKFFIIGIIITIFALIVMGVFKTFIR